MCAINPKGLAEIKEYELQQKTIKKPAKWDGKYRLVILILRNGKDFLEILFVIG